MTISSTGQIVGVRLNPLDDAACRAWITHATAADAATPPNAAGLRWLLAHCDAGAVWGRCDSNGWVLSSTVFPHLSPVPTAANIQQLRLFGPQSEVFIWRTSDGFTGRELWDDESSPRDESLLPSEEDRLLLGDRVVWDEDVGGHTPSIDDFTLVGDGKGSRHAVPVACSPQDFGRDPNRKWPLRLRVKHYFTHDDETGLVRVAATRLVDVCDEPKDPQP